MKFGIIILILLMAFQSLSGQDTIRSLVISEARIDAPHLLYIELSNRGTIPIRLSQFEIGSIWSQGVPFRAEPGNFTFLPDEILLPGESFLMCNKNDYLPEQHAKGLIEEFPIESYNKPDLLEKADFIVHLKESEPPEESDEISEGFHSVFNIWGQHCIYIEQHFPSGDSVVTDQVNGIFNEMPQVEGYSVAGFPEATRKATLIRKHNVTTGNPDFNSARGVGINDSEWMVIPNQGDRWRKTFWTAGNDVNATIDKNTLESDIAAVDFEKKTITVPWGTLRADDILNYFTEKPGIAWNYHCNTNPEDSLCQAAKTGDKIELFACGNGFHSMTFTIIVKEPPSGANELLPVDNRDKNGSWRYHLQSGMLDWPRITRSKNPIDTIWGWGGGIPFVTRSDSLLERLEKPPDAAIDIEWVDNIQRPVIKNGDVLKVTAANKEVKRYYISVRDYIPDHNALLSAITWPDLPEDLRGMFGWNGDTIPGFSPGVFIYRLKLPWYIESVPGLIAQTQGINASVDVKRAKSLWGSTEDRTIKFIVTAEDQLNTNCYTIELIKETKPENVQPFHAKPFLSEYIFFDQWGNSYGEICNPGNQPLDLSNYLILQKWGTNPAEMISSGDGADEWLDRYDKYVPGYKWEAEEKWKTRPAFLVRDLSVNPIVQPGDVFCFGSIHNDRFTKPNWLPHYVWPVPEQLDVQFNNMKGLNVYKNPWNEEISASGSPIRKWFNSAWCMFEILNDSVKLGLKPATDPRDFQLIEAFGMADASQWVIGGEKTNMITSYIRKPFIYKGNPELEGSFGTNPENCEWTWTNWNRQDKQILGWPLDMLNIAANLGQHYFFPPTHFISTIKSVSYKISEGFSSSEEIRGIKTGTLAKNFIANIIKKDKAQSLKIIQKTDGSELLPEQLVEMHDTLVVVSADSSNCTKYILHVNDQGLNSDAVLTSSLYQIKLHSYPENSLDTTTSKGFIHGMEYGTLLKTILANLKVPQGAELNIINSKGEYVSTKQLNFDTSYVYTTVSPDIFLEVIAEDKITTIVYQLLPESAENEAILLSDVYVVSQKLHLIEHVPRATNVETFLDKIIPVLGASVTIHDVLGNEKTTGKIYQDDKVVVTSADGSVRNVYFLSMLHDQFIQQTTYLAYILSDIYDIDQVNNSINGVSGSTTLDAFFSKISPAAGATVAVTDENGNIKTNGNIDRTDKVTVTSSDGKIKTEYTFGRLTGAVSVAEKQNQIRIFPNPASGEIAIDGIQPGSMIQVYNSSGVLLFDKNSTGNSEVISLKSYPPGFYFVSAHYPSGIKETVKIMMK